MIGRPEEEPTPQSLVGGATHTIGTAAPVLPSSGGPSEGSRGPSEGPLILLFIIATLAASAFVLMRAEDNAVKDPKQKAARGEIKGFGELSMIRPENLRQALAKVSSGAHPLVTNIRIAADRINVSARNADGFRRYLTIDPGFGVKSDDAGVGEDFSVPVSRIDADAPRRMLKLVVAKTGLPSSAFDYVTTSFSPNSKATWFMSMKEGPARGRQWIAEPDGSDIRRPGELSSADKRRNRKARLDAERRQKRLQLIIKRRTTCISKARDATGVSKCLERYQL